jgi:Ni,Fe-hydrogenase I large subunit
VRAVENAVGVQIPKNARLIRNLLHGAQFQHDHIVHFYHLHALDWVDIVSALSADPAKTAQLSDNVSNAPWGGTNYFRNVQQRIKTFVDSGQVPTTLKRCACRPRRPACTPSSAQKTPICNLWLWAESPPLKI